MLIGLTGYQKSGKSTAAKHLEDKGYTRINFKDALITEMKENMPDVLHKLGQIYSTQQRQSHEVGVDWLFDVKPPVMRALMQNYGTDTRRKDRDSYWIDKWEAAYCEHHPAATVADDVRFLNEADAIKRYGGKIIRIVRSDIQGGGTHASETEMDQIVPDYTIEVAEGDVDKLYEALDVTLEMINRKAA